MGVSERLYRHFYPDRRLSGTVFFYERLRSDLRPGMHVLNVGAGPGDEPGSPAFPIRDLRNETWTVHGCDPDPAVLGNRQVDDARRMPTNGTLPYGVGVFDVAFADYVLEHVEDPRAFLSQVHRVLKPGGVFHFRTPNLYHYVSVAARLLPYRAHALTSNRARNLGAEAHEPYPTYHQMNTRRDLKRLSADAGFRETDFVLIEAEPSYLVFNTVAFLMGVAYERTVNRLSMLQGIRANIVGRMVK